ncbi:MAG: hypothetical protein JW748_05555 [Anaerolineales bacterium]|nr:hypothetical protein [Anaerolineales bacterium]
MNQETLGYPLENGYIDHWLLAGPEIIPVDELRRFGHPPDKLQMAKAHFQPNLGIDGDPVEYGDCRIGDTQEKWRYVRTRPDHLVDLSAFHPLPRYLRAWAYVEIESPLEQEAGAVLFSDGPADVWIQNRHIHRREKFQGRIPDRVRFPIRLKEGANRVMVRFETAADRETAFGMALQLVDFQTKQGAEGRVVLIPTCAPSAKYRLKMEELFETCHIRQDVYARMEEIAVHFPEGPAVTTPFNIRMQTKGGSIFAEARRDGRKTEPRQPLGFPYQSPEGSYQLRFMPPPVEFYEQNVRISRWREFYAATNVFSPLPYGSYPDRRLECLQDAAGRKNNLFGEIAKMEGGWWKDVAVQTVEKAIEEVNARSAGSERLLCGLLGMRCRYAENDRFPAEVRAPLAACTLGFRYGDDEPGADIMNFRGESGSILFHTCEILAGQLHPDEVFTGSGKNGRWHREQGERLASEWMKKRAGGGFREWDSPAAFEEMVLGLSTLTSLAENPEILEMASLVLDKLCFTLAVNSFQGVFGSTHARASAADIRTGYRQPTSGITRLLWGMGIFNDHILGAVGLACSTYELPPILAAIAADRADEIWSKEQHSEGEGTAATVNKVTYKSPDGMLASAQDWNPGEPGSREHIWQATLSPMATVFTTHPGCASESDGRRPDAWSGNAVLPRVAQWKDMLIAIYQFPDDDRMGFTHAYFPVHAMDAYEIRDGWAFGKAGDGYIALAAARGMEFQTSGDNACRELRSSGSPNIWLCQMGRAALDGSFTEFQEKVFRLPVQFDGAQVEITGLRGDHLSFGWQFPLLVNGREEPLSGFRHYDNLYCTCDMGAPEMEIRHGRDALRLHFEEDPGKEQGGT